MADDLSFNIKAIYEQAAAAFRQIADELDTVNKKLDELDVAKANPSVTLGGTTTFTADVDALKAKLDALSSDKANPTIGANGLTETRAAIDLLKAQLDELDAMHATPSVELQGEIAAKIAEINAELDALGAKTVHPEVKVDTDTAVANIRRLGDETDSLVSKFNGLDLGSTKWAAISAAILPAIQSIGELSGALGLVPAVALGATASLATVVVGVQGMGDAFTAAQKATDAQAAAVKADAAAQTANTTAVQAATTAGTANIAALQQRVTAGAANVASLKAEQAAGQDVATQLKAAETAQLGNVAALKQAQTSYTGNTSATSAYTAAQQNANSAAAQAKSAHEAAAKAADAQAAAMTNLAPAAQQVVSQVLQLDPAFKAARLEVQQQLFVGLGADIKAIGATDLPVMTTALGGVGSALNDAGHQLTLFVTSKAAVADYKTVFDNIASAGHSLAEAVKPILQIITDVTTVGSTFLPGLAQDFASAAQSAADFVAKARETGQLQQWIQTGIDAVGQLWDAFKNVVAIIADLTVSPGFGPSFLQSLDAVTAAIRWLLENVPPLTTAVQLFVDAWVLAKIVQGLSGMVTSITGAATSIGLLTKAAEGATGAAGLLGVSLNPVGLALAALGVAIVAVVTHWDEFIKGFKDAGAVAVTTAKDIVDITKAIADAFTGNFDAAGRAFDAINKRDADLRTQLMDTSGFDKAKQGADDLSTSLGQVGNPPPKPIMFDVDINPATNKILQMDGAAQAEANKQWMLKFEGDTTGVLSKITEAQGQLDKFTLNTPIVRIAGDITNLAATIPQATSLANSVKSPPPVKFTGDASDVTAKSGQAQSAAQAVTPQHNTTFIGAVDDINNKANSVTTLIGGVVQSWLTSFFGDSSNLGAAATTSKSAIDGVPSTHGSAFTGDASGLSGAAASAASAIDAVPLDHGPTAFTGDPSDVTAGAGQASTAIGAVPDTHPTTMTGDPSNLVAGAGQATSSITAIPGDHATMITAEDQSSSVISGIVSALSSIPTFIQTVVQTVYQSVGGAGGMIATSAAAGGVLPMAPGGALSPNMSGGMAAIIPPNTWRVIGDRMVDDEAFIPINGSASSTAILAETANRKGFALAPMALGGIVDPYIVHPNYDFGALYNSLYPPVPVPDPIPVPAPGPGGGGGHGHHGHGWDWLEDLLGTRWPSGSGGRGGGPGGSSGGGGGSPSWPEMIPHMQVAFTAALQEVFSAGVRTDVDYNSLTLRVNQTNRLNARR